MQLVSWILVATSSTAGCHKFGQPNQNVPWMGTILVKVETSNEQQEKTIDSITQYIYGI